MSIAISLIILYGATRLCQQSIYILLEFTPAHIDLPEVRNELMKVPGVEDAHDIHAWTIASGVHAMSAHLRVSDQPVSACSCIIKACEHLLETKYQIRHTTLQLEYNDCDMGVCYFKGFMKEDKDQKEEKLPRRHRPRNPRLHDGSKDVRTICTKVWVRDRDCTSQ